MLGPLEDLAALEGLPEKGRIAVDVAHHARLIDLGVARADEARRYRC